MKEKFIITVTNHIEGGSVEKYIDTICVNVVLGTNVFSDIASSFSDVFGGRSGSYMNKLEIIYDESKKNLMKKAQGLGANAIVGFSVDFDEISGGGKSMFMVSASGTACIVKHQHVEKEQEYIENIPSEILELEVTRYQIRNELNREQTLRKDFRDFLLEHPMPEIVHSLLGLYLKAKKNYKETGYVSANNGVSWTMEFVPKYLKLLPTDSILDAIYTVFSDNKEELVEFVVEYNLFSPRKLLSIVNNDVHLAIALLGAKKEFYKKEDLSSMKEILEVLESLPDTGKVVFVKGGMLHKGEEKYICQYEHVNSKELSFCKYCGLNIKGLKVSEVEKINTFRDKISVLSKLFK